MVINKKEIWRVQLERKDNEDDNDILMTFFDILYGRHETYIVDNRPVILVGYWSSTFDLPIIIGRNIVHGYRQARFEKDMNGEYLKYRMKMNNKIQIVPMPKFNRKGILSLDLALFVENDYLFKKTAYNMSLKHISALIEKRSPRQESGVLAPYYFDNDKDLFREYLDNDINETITVFNYYIDSRLSFISALNLPLCSIYYTDVQCQEMNLTYRNIILGNDPIFPLISNEQDLKTSDEEAALFLGIQDELASPLLLLSKEQYERFMTSEGRYQGAYSGSINWGTFNNVLHLDYRSFYPFIMLLMAKLDWQRYGGTFIDGLLEHMNKRFEIKRKIDKLKQELEQEKEQDNLYRARDIEKNINKHTSMEQAIKIIINSAYGLRGKDNGIFSDIKLASMVTACGRVLIRFCLYHLLVQNSNIKVIQVDTDGIYITGADYIEIKEWLHGFNDMIKQRFHHMGQLELDDPIIAMTIPPNKKKTGGKCKNYVYSERTGSGNIKVNIVGSMLISKNTLCKAQKEMIREFFIRVHSNNYSKGIEYEQVLSDIKREWMQRKMKIEKDDIVFKLNINKYPRCKVFQKLFSYEEDFEPTMILYAVTKCDDKGLKTEVKRIDDIESIDQVCMIYYYDVVYKKLKEYTGMETKAKGRKRPNQRTIMDYYRIKKARIK